MATNLRLIIVGLGLIGLRHAEAIKQTQGVELQAVVETNSQGISEARKRGLRVYDSIIDCIESENSDGIILATPTTLHVEQAKICVDQGIPTLIEKPIAVNSADAEFLISAAKEADVPILVGHHRRFNPLIQKAKQVVEGGQIGDLCAINVTCWFYKPDYYFDCAPWRTKKGAGPVSVNLVHDIDLMRYLAGEVVSVQALSRQSIRGFENEELASALLSFESGTVGTVSVSDSIVSPWSWELTAAENPAYAPTDQSCYQIGGSKASLSIPDLRIWSHESFETPDWWTPMNSKTLTRAFSNPLVNQIEHFSRVIKGKEKPIVSGAEGVKTLKVIEAIQKAASLQQRVSI